MDPHLYLPQFFYVHRTKFALLAVFYCSQVIGAVLQASLCYMIEFMICSFFNPSCLLRQFIIDVLSQDSVLTQHYMPFYYIEEAEH